MESLARPYSATVNATGGNPTYTFSATGLPGGLSMSASGQITGTPGAAGTSTAHITVTDSTTPTHLTATANLSITIVAPLTVTTASPLPTGIDGNAYDVTVSAGGGTQPYTFSATGLPAGLSMSVSGLISGTPSSFGSTTVTVTVTDSTTPTHQTAQALLGLTINAPASPAFSITGASVGKNLQTAVIVTLSQASSGPLNVTISSNNPGLVALAAGAEDTGTGSISHLLNPGITQFAVYVQGLSNSGSVQLTAAASGYLAGYSTVSLTPSAFVLSGPNGIGGSFVTNQLVSTPLTVTAVQLDGSGNPGPSPIDNGRTGRDRNARSGRRHRRVRQSRVAHIQR